MTVTTSRKPAAPLAFAKGKGSDARNLAFADVSTFAYLEGKSRAETVDTLRRALGKSPTDAQLDACKLAYVIGRVAGKLQHADGAVAAIDFARDIVTAYAAPVKDGVAARKLRKGQKGRRTVEQHKAVRAAEEAWSQMKAEVAPTQSSAKTQAQRNDAKKSTRAPAMAGSTQRGKAGAAPTHSELVKAPAPTTAAEVAQHVRLQAASLLAFANKNAKLVSASDGKAIRAFCAALATAE